jgi:hypothetical protein
MRQFLPLLLSGLLFFPEVIWAQETRTSIPCAGTIKTRQSGRLSSCILAADYPTPEGVLPSGSRVLFLNDGTPYECVISRESAFGEHLLPAKTTVFYNHWGNRFSFWLPKETRLAGFAVRKSTDGIGNKLHTNGTLKAIWLAYDQDISGVPCSSSQNIFRFGWSVMTLGTKRMVWFYEDGTLQQAMLSRDYSAQGFSFKKGDLIYLDQNGRIVQNAKWME